MDSTDLSAKSFLINTNVLLRHRSCTTFSDSCELQQSKTGQNDLETVEDRSKSITLDELWIEYIEKMKRIGRSAKYIQQIGYARKAFDFGRMRSFQKSHLET